jgi:hypothetical protein
MNDNVDRTMNPLVKHGVYVEGNMENISETIPINISNDPNIIENVFIGAECSPEEIHMITPPCLRSFTNVFTWSYEEMPGIDPRIVEHEINTYPNAKHVRQKLRPVNPRKEMTIKVEVEKLLKVGFIYLVPLTEWVLNPIPVDKKQGTIHVCMDFRDLNKACPKDNFLIHLSIKLSMNVWAYEIFSFMDGFFGYNQIQIKPKDQHKTTFIFPWGMFAYQKMPFGLKNVGATFQWAMYFSFHDMKHIVEAYLDDLDSHSHHRFDHLDHLHHVFQDVCYYHIQLIHTNVIFVSLQGISLVLSCQTKGSLWTL